MPPPAPRKPPNDLPPAAAAVIVGFDPGLHRTGYAVVVAEARPRLVEAGVLRIPADLPLAERLRRLHADAAEILADHRPAEVAVEELFSHYARPRTAVLMGHARGVLLLAAAAAGATVASYLPTRVKKAVAGAGHAGKEQIQRAVMIEFNLAEPPEPPDVADALAIALCHCHARRHPEHL